MKKRTVRFLTVLLAVTMLLGIAPVNVFALTADETLEYLSYSINDDGIHITDCDISASGDLVIPDKIEGQPVTAIEGRAFRYCESISNITIPDSVTSIGEEAFSNCFALRSIVIPDGVTSIEEGTFFRCISLSNIVIPDSITSIGSSAFESCYSLSNIELPKNITSIEDCTFYSCTSLSNFEIQENISSIGGWAFASCTSLTEITIPEGVTEIGDVPFIGCSKLEKIKVDENNKYYDSRENCNAIIETETNTLIQGCENTVIPESITSFGEGAFALITGLTEITIPKSITYIAPRAFMGCTSLSDITIPDSITDIDDCAFDGCISLKSIYIPSSVVSVGYGLFRRCYSLDSIVVDENNPVFDSRNNCNAIIGTETNTLIQGCNNSFIPESIDFISFFAFYGCKGLKTIDIPDGITEIDYDTFYGCTGVTSVHYGKNLKDNFSYALPGLEEITVDPENPNFCVFDNALYTKDKSELLSYPLSCQDKDIYLAPECTKISEGCFIEYNNRISCDLGNGYSDKKYNLFITDSEQYESLKYSLPSLPLEHIYVNGNESTDLSVINNGAGDNEIDFIKYYIYYFLHNNEIFNGIWEEIEVIENKYDEMVKEGLISKKDADYFMHRETQNYLIEKGYLEQLEPTKETSDIFFKRLGIFDNVFSSDYFVSSDEAFEQYCEAVNNLYLAATFSYRYPERAEITSFKPSVSGCGAEKVINYYESVTYTASSAAPVQEYQWYVNGEYVGSGESYTVEKPVKDYTVGVTAVYPNGYKESSDVTSVKLDKSVCKPSISECGAEKEIKYKETVTYTVSASVPAQEYQWYVNGEYVGSGESYTVENPESDYTVSVTAVYSDGSAQSSDTTSVKVKSPTFIEKIANVFEKIFNFFTSIFNKIFG